MQNLKIFICKNNSHKAIDFLLERFYDYALELFLESGVYLVQMPPNVKTCIENCDFQSIQKYKIELIFGPSSEQELICRQKDIPFYSYVAPNVKREFVKKIRNVIFTVADYLAGVAARVSAFIEPSLRKDRKSTLSRAEVIIMRPDGIGDYVLFRNFLLEVYKKYGRFTIVVNESFSNLMQLDYKIAKKVIFLNRKRFMQDIFYRLNFVYRLKLRHFAMLINPVFSRDELSENLAKNINALVKIAQSGDNYNLPRAKLDAQNYHFIIKSQKEIVFEFERNCYFFSKVLKAPLMCTYQREPKVDRKRKSQNALLNKKSSIRNVHFGLDARKQFISKFVDVLAPLMQEAESRGVFAFFIGASSARRKWSEQKFAQVGQFLQKAGFSVAIFGASEDKSSASAIACELDSKRLINLCGKTSLMELAIGISYCTGLLSNETGAVHIAMGLQTRNVFVLSVANHLERFIPYPLTPHTRYIPLYPPLVERSYAAYVKISNRLYSPLDINEISSEYVISRIKDELESPKGSA